MESEGQMRKHVGSAVFCPAQIEFGGLQTAAPWVGFGASLW